MKFANSIGLGCFLLAACSQPQPANDQPASTPLDGAASADFNTVYTNEQIDQIAHRAMDGERRNDTATPSPENR